MSDKVIWPALMLIYGAIVLFGSVVLCRLTEIRDELRKANRLGPQQRGAS